MTNSNFKNGFWTTGLAMFAMFFGSGNLIFPVSLGIWAKQETSLAMVGLFFTAVFVPFFSLGLMLFYQGDFRLFFAPLGTYGRNALSYIILAMLGPLGVLPRCVAFSYSTFALYVPKASLWLFSLVSFLLIFLLSYKKNNVVNVLGNLLTPLLLIALFVMVFYGFQSPIVSEGGNTLSPAKNLVTGFVEGYKTFDIFAALFFASAIIPNLKAKNQGVANRKLVSYLIKACVIGMALLFLVYASLGFLAAKLSDTLQNIPKEQLVGIISQDVMGQQGGLIANLIVSLACLTTAISLAVVSAEFLKKEIFIHTSYQNNLIIVCLVGFLVSLMGFAGIMSILQPVIVVICPAVVALIFGNTLKLLTGRCLSSRLFYGVLALSAVWHFFS